LNLDTLLSQCIGFLGCLLDARFSKISQASTYSMMSKVLGRLQRRRSFCRWCTWQVIFVRSFFRRCSYWKFFNYFYNREF